METTATVMASDYNHSTWGDGKKKSTDDLSFYITRFSYRVSGVVYHGQLQSKEVRILGSKFSIRYDPSNPEYNSVAGGDKEIGSRMLFWCLIVAGLLIFALIFRYLL